MKTISVGFDTHLSEEVTTLCTCWRIVRLDGQEFYFTNLDKDIEFPISSGTVYLTNIGISRANLSNDSSFGVANTDIIGIFNSVDLNVLDLQNGLFNYATVFQFLVNYEDLTQGDLKLGRFTFGEVTLTDTGIFTVEMRGMTQSLRQKNIVETYAAECPADLGDVRCGVDLIPTMVARITAYEVGDLVRASSLGEAFTPATLQVSADIDLNDESPNAAAAVIGSGASRTTITTKVGAGAIEFTPGGSPVNSYVRFPDIPAYHIGTGKFNIEAYVRFKDLTKVDQTIASQLRNAAGGNRAWDFLRNGGNLELRIHGDGGSTPTATIVGAFAWAIDTWYHIEVGRDGSGDIRLFVNGTQVGSTVNHTGTFFNSTTALRLGKIDSSSANYHSLDGFIDQFRFIVGDVLHTAGFTPSVLPFPEEVLEEDISLVDFDGRDYLCTISGTTAAKQPTYDTIINNITADGTASFKSQEASFQSATVLSITDNRKFKVTELTPAIDFPDGYFNGGAIIWQTGDNSGAAIEVKFYLSDDGVTIEQEIEMYLAPSFTIQVGDELGIYLGCDRLISTCRDKFNNVLNFRGFPHVPGPSFVGTQVPKAKT